MPSRADSIRGSAPLKLTTAVPLPRCFCGVSPVEADAHVHGSTQGMRCARPPPMIEARSPHPGANLSSHSELRGIRLGEPAPYLFSAGTRPRGCTTRCTRRPRRTASTSHSSCAPTIVADSPAAQEPPHLGDSRERLAHASGRLASFLLALVAGAAVAAALISILARLFGQVAGEPLVISTSH